MKNSRDFKPKYKNLPVRREVFALGALFERVSRREFSRANCQTALMPKPGARAAHYKTMAATWRKQHARFAKYPPIVPPDDELMRLYMLFSTALAVEYLRGDADFPRVAPPETVSLEDSSRWIIDRFRENKDMEWETAYLIQTLVMPGLGRAVKPDTEKLRTAAVGFAKLRNEWKVFHRRVENTQMPAAFGELMPVFRAYTSHLGAFFEAWPAAIERHVQVREEIGHWDDESCHTLMVPQIPGFEEFDDLNKRTAKEVGRLLQEARKAR